jgi:hypothetical protein
LVNRASDEGGLDSEGKLCTTTKETTMTESPLAPDWGHRHGVTHLWNEIVPGLSVGGTSDEDHVGLGRPFVDEERRDRLSGRMYRHFYIDEADITLEQFDAVVTLYAWARPVGWGVEELRWGIMDDREHAVGFDPQTMQETVRWTHRRWSQGKRVLVRCQAGLNRSSLVAALVLVRDGMEPQDAVDKVRRMRTGQALFNKQFYEFIVDTDPEFWRG